MSTIKFSVVTSSDGCSKNESEDKTGKLLCEYLRKKEFIIDNYSVVPDEKDVIKEKLMYLCDNLKSDVVITNGGTSFSKTDITPEATLEVLQKEIPGFSEIMRVNSYKRNNRAILSRGVSGIRRKTIIINLPGNPEAALECIDIVIEPLMHGLKILNEEVLDSDLDK